MSGGMKPDREREFLAAFRGWGGRPPATGSHAAARRVLAALPEPRAPFRLRLLAATAVTLLAAFLALWRAGWRPQSAVAPAALPEPLADNVVLWYIDPDTPVYFVLGPFSDQGGSS